jgi:hypothetical protein
MGWTWEVRAFVKVKPDWGGYTYEQVYAGESLIRALTAARRAKRSGAGCVKIEWR